MEINMIIGSFATISSLSIMLFLFYTLFELLFLERKKPKKISKIVGASARPMQVQQRHSAFHKSLPGQTWDLTSGSVNINAIWDSSSDNLWQAFSSMDLDNSVKVLSGLPELQRKHVLERLPINPKVKKQFQAHVDKVSKLPHSSSIKLESQPIK